MKRLTFLMTFATLLIGLLIGTIARTQTSPLLLTAGAAGPTPANGLWCPFNDACTYDNTNAQQPVTALVPMYLEVVVPYPGLLVNNISFDLYTTGSGGPIAFYFMTTSGSPIAGSTCILSSPSGGVVNNCQYGSTATLSAGPALLGICSVGAARIYAAVGSSSIGADLANQGESGSTYKMFQEGTSANYCTGGTPTIPTSIGTRSALSGSVTLPGLAIH